LENNLHNLFIINLLGNILRRELLSKFMLLQGSEILVYHCLWNLTEILPYLFGGMQPHKPNVANQSNCNPNTQVHAVPFIAEVPPQKGVESDVLNRPKHLFSGNKDIISSVWTCANAITEFRHPPGPCQLDSPISCVGLHFCFILVGIQCCRSAHHPPTISRNMLLLGLGASITEGALMLSLIYPHAV
jgi:hypothetical protein